MDVRRRFIVPHWCLSWTSLSSKHFKNFSSHTTFRQGLFYSLINAPQFWHLWHPPSLSTSMLFEVRHHPGLSQTIQAWHVTGHWEMFADKTFGNNHLFHPDLIIPQTFQLDWCPPVFCSAITCMAILGC